MSGAWVYIERWAEDTDVGLNRYIIWESERLNVDSDGRFSIENVPTGIVRVRAGAKGFHQYISRDFVVADRDERDIELLLYR